MLDIWLSLQKNVNGHFEKGGLKKRVSAFTIHSYLYSFHSETRLHIHTRASERTRRRTVLYIEQGGSGVSQSRPTQWKGRKKGTQQPVQLSSFSVLRHFSPTAWRGAVPLRERTTCCWTKRKSRVALDVEPSCFPTTISGIWVVKVITGRAWGLPSEQKKLPLE